MTFKCYWDTTMFLIQPGICQFTRLNFQIITSWFPWCLPGWKLRSESISPHRGTETGCKNYFFYLENSLILLSFLSYFLSFINQLLKSWRYFNVDSRKLKRSCYCYCDCEQYNFPQFRYKSKQRYALTLVSFWDYFLWVCLHLGNSLKIIF